MNRAMFVVVGLALAGWSCSTRPAPPGDLTGGRSATVVGPTEEAAGEPTPAELAALRERAIQELLSASADADPQVRVNAVESLLEAPARLGEVAGQLLDDEHVAVRAVTAYAVGRAGVRGYEATLVALTRAESPFVRASAWYALHMTSGGVNPTPLSGLLLRHPSIRVRSHTAFLIGEMGERSARGLLREARVSVPERASEQELRLFYLQVAEALVKLGDDRSIEGIRGALYPSRPEELEATALAVQIIGALNDRGSIDALIYLTASQDQQGNLQPAEIRLAAVASAARMGATSGVFIADEYERDRSDELRALAAEVYGWTGDASRLSRLEAMLGDESARVRISAAEGLLRVIASLRARRR